MAKEKEWSIRLSDRFGVNPSIETCFFCGKDKGLILFGKLKDDVEAPRQICMNHEPCDECVGFMKQGVILISVDESKTDDPQNPWRSGCGVVVSEDFIRRTVQPELAEQILKQRVSFVPDEAWDLLGLPRDEVKDADAG